MRKSGWVIWLSRRWFAARKASGGAASTVLATAGIAVGVMALVVVLGVMNGFQLGYIDSILEISSYHVRVPSPGTGNPDAGFERRLGELPGLRSVTPFAETQVLLGSGSGRDTPARLRGLPRDAFERDPGLALALGLPVNALAAASLAGQGGLVLGSELARYLNVQEGDRVEVLMMRASEEAGLETTTRSLEVASVFRSGFYEYDSSLALVDDATWTSLLPKGEKASWTFGLKLDNRDRDGAVVAALRAEGIAGAEGWRDYNRSFFGALRTEKTMMMLLVGLIFVVVGVNIYQSMRRSVFERMEEMALVKALGGGGAQLRRIFILDGFATGATGAFIGLVLGLLVATNVNAIFAGIGDCLNAASRFIARLAGGQSADFSIFSPEYFYLLEVPVRVLFPETLAIVAAAIGSAAFAAALASSRLSTLEPAELLRHE